MAANYDADIINTGYGVYKWVFGRKRDLRSGCYSPSSGRYASHEEAMAAARDHYEDPDLTPAERARLR
jgi:hypothetical protein